MSKNKEEYNKSFVIKNVSKRYGFEKTELSEGISFVLNCSFYKTKYDNIYITDYDFRNYDDLEKKDLSMLLYRCSGVVNAQVISNTLLIDENAFNFVLDNFMYESSNKL
ncbi:hypothetical protein Phi19:1_gp067 [Cellulophaga phage phi19:1]|uniref:Uncharacterized protein n=1 Tax=Cellulophaga phage phi19:1 TaxID=1327970 RepID=R9ZYD9_9CAUD|nr:hypothetical protein Phi19:1_gp067 [Cellulophaga phage phi19:1]AGO47357.1 hypothetical protein Phi19:1_gp067 [Cellulophaga phage phi19:1]